MWLPISATSMSNMRLNYRTAFNRRSNIIINGCGDSGQTTFTLWLIDGRRLDSGYLNFYDESDLHEMGLHFYRRALQMLRRAIPTRKVREARNQ